jgi:para-nitrobenzyl esterase
MVYIVFVKPSIRFSKWFFYLSVCLFVVGCSDEEETAPIDSMGNEDVVAEADLTPDLIGTDDQGSTDVDGADSQDTGNTEEPDTIVDLVPDSPPIETIEVTTGSGVVQGQLDDGLMIFRGIPYAAPPTGELRFHPPVAHEGWSDALDTTQFGKICPQLENELSSATGWDEDCLNLNIWGHDDRGIRPVMVFIHGGAYVFGAGSEALYEGSNLARNGDVLVVTLNYRLGAFGFLATEELAADNDGLVGNFGLLDQVLALEWVQENISFFGGDPENITVFGESAGGGSICSLLGAEDALGLFHRAIIQSGGGCYGFMEASLEAPEGAFPFEYGAQIVGHTYCPDVDMSEVDCLRSLTAQEILDANGLADEVIGGAFGLGNFGPIIDGVFLSEDPLLTIKAGRSGGVPVIIGSNADEMTLWTETGIITIEDEADLDALIYEWFDDDSMAEDIKALYPLEEYDSAEDAFTAASSDLFFICPSLLFGEEVSSVWRGSGMSDVYLYHFTQPVGGVMAALGATHAWELHHVFGNLDDIFGLGFMSGSEEDYLISEAMQGAWSSFARDGSPSSLPEWRATGPGVPQIALIDEPITITDEIRDGRCEALMEIMFR